MSLEGLQGNIDNLALNLFEVIRSHADPPIERQGKLCKLQLCFEETLSIVGNIKGFDETQMSLDEDIRMLDYEYLETQGHVRLLEERLNCLRKNCDEKLAKNEENHSTVTFVQWQNVCTKCRHP